MLLATCHLEVMHGSLTVNSWHCLQFVHGMLKAHQSSFTVEPASCWKGSKRFGTTLFYDFKIIRDHYRSVSCYTSMQLYSNIRTQCCKDTANLAKFIEKMSRGWRERKSLRVSSGSLDFWLPLKDAGLLSSSGGWEVWRKVGCNYPWNPLGSRIECLNRVSSFGHGRVRDSLRKNNEEQWKGRLFVCNGKKAWEAQKQRASRFINSEFLVSLFLWSSLYFLLFDGTELTLSISSYFLLDWNSPKGVPSLFSLPLSVLCLLSLCFARKLPLSLLLLASSLSCSLLRFFLLPFSTLSQILI